MTLLLLWQRPPCPPGVSLWTYNIQDGCGFIPPQSIHDIQLGNYDLMLLTEKNIPDTVYCHNHLGHDIVYYQEAVTLDRGAQEGVGMVIRELP